MVKRTLLLVLIFVLAIPVLAQDSTPEIEPQGETDYFARYEGIPFSRGEDGGFVLGEEDAPITVVEFADFMCPHCQNYQETAHQFIEDYVKTGQAKFEYRMFPIVNPNYSNLTAQYAECANEQVDGAFWPAHDVLYDLAKTGNVGPDTSETLASTLGLDAAALSACAETADQYQTDYDLGSAAGVSGTPATMIRTPEGELGWVRLENQTFSSGGLPIDLLVQVMEAEDLSAIVVVPEPVFANLFVEAAEDDACVAPCWNGITPGTTTWEEATAIVEGNAQTVNPQTAEDPNSEAKMLQWATITSQAANRMITNDGETVASLTLVSPAEVTTGEVFEAMGDPASALASQTEQGAIVISLVYPEQSMIVAAYIVPDESGEFTFNEETEVLGVNLFAPSEFETVLAQTTVYEWTGYEALDSYMMQQ